MLTSATEATPLLINQAKLYKFISAAQSTMTGGAHMSTFINKHVTGNPINDTRHVPVISTSNDSDYQQCTYFSGLKIYAERAWQF